MLRNKISDRPDRVWFVPNVFPEEGHRRLSAGGAILALSQGLKSARPLGARPIKYPRRDNPRSFVLRVRKSSNRPSCVIFREGTHRIGPSDFVGSLSQMLSRPSGRQSVPMIWMLFDDFPGLAVDPAARIGPRF